MRSPRVHTEMPNDRSAPKRLHLTPDEARRVIDASAKVGRQGERDRLLLTLIYRHGLRVSEAVDLRWGDFDLDDPRQRILRVRRLKGSVDSAHSLEPDEVRWLKRWRQETEDGPYVFRSERCGPMSVDAVQVIAKRAGERAGISVPVHPHMLRHACGYMLANEGIDLRLIQDYLGHKEISNTVRYTALSPKRLAAVRVR